MIQRGENKMAEERYKIGAYVELETREKMDILQERYKKMFGAKPTQGMLIDFLVKNAELAFDKYEKVFEQVENEKK